MDDARRDELIGRAVRFLDDVPADVWDGETLPVPVERIAESHLGLRVIEIDDIAALLGFDAAEIGQISGALLARREQIWVGAHDARSEPGRRRYTIAHEIGHWVLHRERGEVHCRAGEIAPSPFLGPLEAHAWTVDREKEANMFGGVLLMPPGLVREVWERTGGDLGAVAEAFELSPAALGGDPFSRAQVHLAWDSGAVQDYAEAAFAAQ